MIRAQRSVFPVFRSERQAAYLCNQSAASSLLEPEPVMDHQDLPGAQELAGRYTSVDAATLRPGTLIGFRMANCISSGRSCVIVYHAASNSG